MTKSKILHVTVVTTPSFIIILLFSQMLCVQTMAGHHVIVIDPGHGGSHTSGTQAARTLSSPNNAKSPGGLLEKDLTLELSLEIRKQIELLAPSHPGTRINCILTRTRDTNPDFSMRAAACVGSAKPPTAIVSIHFNASENHDCLGSLAVIGSKKDNPNFDRDLEFASGLINATSGAVTKFIPNSKPRKPITDAHLHGGSGSNFFHQLAPHPVLKGVPKCFLEVEFIDRGDVEEKLLNQRQIAFPIIAKAIADYLYLLCEETDKPG